MSCVVFPGQTGPEFKLGNATIMQGDMFKLSTFLASDSAFGPLAVSSLIIFMHKNAS